MILKTFKTYSEKVKQYQYWHPIS